LRRTGFTSGWKDAFCHENLTEATGFLHHGIVRVVKDALRGEPDFFDDVFIVNGFVSPFVGDVLTDRCGGDAEFFCGFFLA